MRAETKWERRDKKRHKEKYGMKVDGRSVFDIEKARQKRIQDGKSSHSDSEGSKGQRD